jgi:hypothetical protein
MPSVTKRTARSICPKQLHRDEVDRDRPFALKPNWG